MKGAQKSKGKVGDTSKIPQNQFSIRAKREVLRNSDKKSYTIGKGKK